MKHEILSQLIDGELKSDQIDVALDHVLADPELQNSWHKLHTLRSIMQDEGPYASHQIVDKVAAALESEPTIMAPENLPAPGISTGAPHSNVVAFTGPKSRVLAYAAIAASLLAIVMVSYSPEQNSTSPAVASAPSSPASRAVEQEMQSMIVQHGEFSGTAALNGLAAYAKVVNGSTVGGVN